MERLAEDLISFQATSAGGKYLFGEAEKGSGMAPKGMVLWLPLFLRYSGPPSLRNSERVYNLATSPIKIYPKPV